MRTKVEKRRVRQDPATALVGAPAISQPAPLSSQSNAGVAASVPAVLASTVLSSAAGELQPDAERRPVSISEAQRLAAANHVVVALGPPVIMGPARLVFDGKGDAGRSVAGDAGMGGITPALTDGMNKVYEKLSAQPVCTTVTAEEKVIKKPPKKRRNNEKKADVALDLSTTSAVHSAARKEVHPSMAESLMIPAPLPVQLQQPPITPPTSSPQHPLTCSPQHGSLHNSALLCRSPPNPTHLLQQTPPSSSEPATDTASDSVDMMHSTDVTDMHTAAEEGTSETEFVRSESEVLPVPVSDLVLPLSQTHQAEVQSLVLQPEAIQTLNAEEGELSSATSTSLLQPPTWLLTPQENPPGREGSEHESLAASNQKTAQAVQEASSEPVVSPSTKISKKAGKKTASKSKSAKSRKTADEEVKNSGEKSENTSEGAVVGQSKDSPEAVSNSSAAGSARIPLLDGSSSNTESTKSTTKSTKPQKKKPKEGDENSQRRLQQIEDTINSVIARYVYNSDNVLDFDKLRQAAREADAKAADADNRVTANSCNAMETEAAAAAVTCNDSVTSVSSETRTESQQSANVSSEVSVVSESSKPKKKAAKKKQSETTKAALSNEAEDKSVAETEKAVDLQINSPRKKSKKSKDKKANDVSEDSKNGSESDKKITKARSKKTSAQSKKTSAQSKETTEAQPTEKSEAQSEETTVVTANATTNEEIKPPPAKKKRTSKKKKEVLTTEPMESQPSNDAIPNGHLETEPPVEIPKPAKKRKSKPKAKTENQVDDKTSSNLSVPNGTDASQDTGVCSTTAGPEKEDQETSKPQTKSKPKKAKKRKSDSSEDKELSTKKDAQDNKDNATGQGSKDEDGADSGRINKGEVNVEAKVDSESSKPPPKKKKKKEPKEGEKTETKKKKSPSKSKKAKESAADSQNADTGEATSLQNSLPNSQNEENSDVKSSENSKTKSTEEACTSTEEGQEAKSTTTVEKKVKKTLDEVICPDCGHKTRGQAALSRHMKKLHEKSMVLPYPCPKQPNCDYSASKVSLLARHMLTHSLYMCSRCQFTVDAKDKYEEHLQSEHNVKLDCKLCKKCCRYVKCDTVPMEQHLEVCQGPVPFTCDVCGKEFKYESSLKVHHHTHFPDQPKLYHCTQCEYASNYRANLHKHIQNMHMQRPRDIKCQLCDKLFSTEDNMRRHMKIHTQVRPYKCHKCEKAFKSQCALRGHLVSHEVARPYKCNIDNCQREFRTPKFLKSHQEEFHRLIPKKYHCKVEGCNFSFFKLSHLKRHEISHTGERNFHCDHPGCGKSFRHADNLKVHLRQHTNERPISCPQCKFTCRQKSSLQWHLKKEHNQSLPAGTTDNGVNKEVVIPLDGKPLEGFTLPKGMTFPEGFKLPESLTLPEGVKLPEGVDLAEGVEVVELEKINVIIPAGEGEELPVTITELRPMDLYDFHSDNDSSDEATPGVFKRDRTKMASAAPLPPAPKELLMKNAVFDVLGDDVLNPAAEDGSTKSKKKKSSSKKAGKSKENVSKESQGEKKKDNSKAMGVDEDKKKKKKKASPSKKANPEGKKKTTTSKSKKKAAKQETTEEKENVEEKNDQNGESQAEQINEKTDNQKNENQADQINENTPNQNKDETDDKYEEKQNDDSKGKKNDQSEDKQDDGNSKQDDHSKTETKADEAEVEPKAQSKSPSKPKKSSAKKKTVAKAARKEDETGGEKEKPTKTKVPAKGKKSPKTRTSPKKPTSPKGKPAKPATRKTPPRKAATAKKGGKTGGKKTPAKKGTTRKKTATKKKAPPPKKKAVKKGKDKEEKSAEIETSTTEQKEQTAVTEPKPKDTPVVQNRMQTTRRPRETRNSLAAAEEASSPIRPSSPMDSEEENMPQGAGSPYREFDSQDMDDSSPEPRDSPSPPPSPPRVEEQPPSLPAAELENSPKGEEDIPEMAETQEEAEEGSDAEDIMNDIPLTPPRAPAPPPPESSDEEEMIPSPPTHMPHSADTSDTAAPSSVLTDQPGSQAPDFQQPHSREEFQQPHSHQDFQQPHSREEFQQPLSQQPQSVEYPQHHSREEIIQPHSREEYPQHHSREEYSQPHSREDYSQPLSREDYSQPHSGEEYPQPLSREEYSQPHSREEYSQPHSREEYPQPHSREEYSQPQSREEYPQQHSREDLQAQGSVPEPMSDSVHSVRSEGLPEDVAMPHSVTQYDAVAAQAIPTSEAESAYQYLQGLAQSGETISEPLAGEPSRLQQLEALAEKPHEDSRSVTDMVKSPVGAAPTSVITSLSPSATSLPISTPETSSRRMEILSTDRQVDQALIRDSPVLPRLGEGAYDAFSALNPLAASAARDNSNLFPAPPSTPTFMRLTESDAMLQRQRMTTPFLPTAQPPERSLSRLPESSLQPPNPTALLRRPATMAEGMFSGTPGMPQAMPRNPFTNTWAGQDVRPSHWGQAPTYLQRPTNAPTTPFPFPTKENYQFMFDPTVRPGVTDRNMFASLSGSQSQRDLASEPNPFQLDRFDLSTYFGSHPYSGATGLDYSRSAVSAASKTFDERYRQTAVSMSEFRPLPPTTSTDMFSGIGVGVNSLNSASFNLDKYAMYGRDTMYHAAAQQLSDNTNSAFLTHATPTQHSMFDRDYPHRSLYPHQNPAYPLFNERQYPAAAKLTGHPAPTAMSHERDFMARPSANENQMQDPYRCGMLYNVVNRYSFE